MHPIPGWIPVFFVGKGAGRIFFRSQWLLLLLPLRCGDFRLSALSAIITSLVDFGSRRVVVCSKNMSRDDTCEAKTVEKPVSYIPINSIFALS